MCGWRVVWRVYGEKFRGNFVMSEVLASMIHYGEKIKVGMERVGISNFITFLENTAEYRYINKKWRENN